MVASAQGLAVTAIIRPPGMGGALPQAGVVINDGLRCHSCTVGGRARAAQGRPKGPTGECPLLPKKSKNGNVVPHVACKEVNRFQKLGDALGTRGTRDTIDTALTGLTWLAGPIVFRHDLTETNPKMCKIR